MSTYNPGSKPSRILEMLAEGDRDFNALVEIMPGGTMSSRKRKAYHCLSNMLADGLMGGSRARYFITQAGSDLLQGLRAGTAVEVGRSAPNVRIFA